ncbi:EH_Signature domain-containing protein [Rhizobiales bacterium GAS113]|nr:EH_Signature domain-containing protein [Rhizobiales bacterium GAS113]
MSEPVLSRLKTILAQRAKFPLPELLAQNVRLPERSRLAALAETLGAYGGASPRPAGVDFAAASASLIEAFGQGKEPAPRDLTLAPWCLWNEMQPLAAEPRALHAWLHMLEAEAISGRLRRLRSLASVYAEQFDPARPGFADIASLLSRVAQRMPEPWRELNRAIGLFDPATAPDRLASAARAIGVSPAGWLLAHGLGGGAGALGLSEYAYLAGLVQFARSPNSEPGQHFAAVRDWSLSGKDAAYPQHAPAMAEAMVGPLAQKVIQPHLQSEMIGFLTKHMGSDPRIGTPRWRMAPRAQAALRKWLVGKSLQQFFAVVERVAKEEHWDYRGAFWRAVEAAGVINDAMVIFEGNAAEVAKQMFGRDVFFAGFQKGGTKQLVYGHTVLLMRVANGVIADWSHNGACVIWRGQDEAKAPPFMHTLYLSQLFQKRSGDKTRNAREAVDIYDHIGSPQYDWQARVAKAIREMTGVHIPSEHYKV